MTNPILRALRPKVPIKEVIKALGIVFGDIGTSPIYTLSVIFVLVQVSHANVLGVLSLIVWTLILLVSVQYAWLAMSLSQKGEGGTIVLREILLPLLPSKKIAFVVTLLSFIGISFLIGDGIITPAISILSAVEGLQLIPGLGVTNQNLLVLLACLICIALFMFQRWGTETVSVAFGPIMVVWFSTLGISGLWWLSQAPWVMQALNPYYAIQFVLSNNLAGFLTLSKVILCATGGEALYADMGHLGRKPILRGWAFAFVVLIITYLGQGAFLILHPTSEQVFYQMLLAQSSFFYVPLLILSLIATVIASQAMISGIFSIVYQGITTNIMPKLKVDYTSRKLRSQIYIPFVNWFLLTLVLFAILEFKASYNLANAYGLAASCTMTITSIMIALIFYLRSSYPKFILACFIIFLNLCFFIASTSKIAYGAYWSVFFALIPLTLILIYTQGKRRLYHSAKPVILNSFLDQYDDARQKIVPIQGTGLFLTKSTRRIPSYIVHTMFINNIMYQDNILVSVATHDKPFGISAGFKEDTQASGLRIFEIHMGYMEILNMEKIFKSAGIDPTVIFYGMEEIETKNIIWRLFALIKKLTPSFVQFYKLPAHKLHGVIVRVEL